jgi:hypothetical protein
VRGGLVFLGLAGLAVGFTFMYTSLQRRETAGVATARPAAAANSRASVEGTVVASAPPRAPDETRSGQLFDRNRGMPSDPDLAAEYEQLNLDYFKNVLPLRTSVRWESGLADLGPLIADNFSVLGLTDGSQILLNPVVERDRDQRRRALCHEMVHMAVWVEDKAHGPVFQNRLRDLAGLGAFKGIVSTDEERDATLETLTRKRTALEAAERALVSDRESLDRTSQAAVDAFNARLRRHQDEMSEYNHLVEQYNLMVSYPDGLARERLKLRADGTVR